jgi:hypothetical protein
MRAAMRDASPELKRHKAKDLAPAKERMKQKGNFDGENDGDGIYRPAYDLENLLHARSRDLKVCSQRSP